jgi:hypothetical protein
MLPTQRFQSRDLRLARDKQSYRPRFHCAARNCDTAVFCRLRPTTRLCCDVSRHHAASLPEPPRSCPLAESSRRFFSRGSATNRQPELSEHRSLGRTHPRPPSIQRCCDDSLNRSLLVPRMRDTSVTWLTDTALPPGSAQLKRRWLHRGDACVPSSRISLSGIEELDNHLRKASHVTDDMPLSGRGQKR